MTVADFLPIVDFWRAAGPARWFARNDGFDLEIRERFLGEHEAAARGQYEDWTQTAPGALALVILLDQFPRNLFRESPHAFATDPLARRHAREALARGFDKATGAMMRPFFYLPFMHSEDLADQERSIALFTALGDEEQLRYAVLHRDIIARFGRFPHRNRALARATSPQEQEFLAGGGFAG
jgi:uncharacterized protein (DUF924 family)